MDLADKVRKTDFNGPYEGLALGTPMQKIANYRVLVEGITKDQYALIRQTTREQYSLEEMAISEGTENRGVVDGLMQSSAALDEVFKKALNIR